MMRILIKVMVALAFLAGSAAWAADPQSTIPELGTAKPTTMATANKDAVCTRCHDESETKPILSIYQTKHGVKGDGRTPSCQTCHGESTAHLKGDPSSQQRPRPDFIFKKGVYAASGDKERADQCLTCHTGTKRHDWDGSQHQVNGLACNDCHKIHQPVDPVRNRATQTEVCFTCHKEQRADSHKISTHPIDAGKIICSDCHNPHGSTGPKLLKKNTVRETCFMCHADKRGPFLFEHQPVSEDCTNCHTPHGSNLTPLLKSRPPFLCDDCHDGPHNSQANYGPNVGGIQSPGSGVTFSPGVAAGKTPSGTAISAAAASPRTAGSSAAGRACMNCHVMVHGSNSPAGAYLQR
jgi:DmsE family decaheme c-type cytochrome